MSLIIAEKPEVAEAILQAMGGSPQSKQKGYFELKNDIVTWCFGHMVELYDPEDYETTDEGKLAAKIWTWGSLPVYIYPYKKKVIEKAQKQYSIIAKLLKDTKTVIHAGDPDEEGQLLVDEILNRERFKGEVKRVLINDLNKDLVIKAFKNVGPNSKYEPMGKAAEARSVSDKYYGYTMTRAFTLQARTDGFDGVFNVGRVKTAIMGMVVRNNLAFEQHIKQEYFEIEGLANCGQVSLTAKYRPIETDTVNDEKKLIDKSQSIYIKEQIETGDCVLKSSKTSSKKISPPLPYSLINLQIDAAKKYDYASDDVLAITQKLREQYKLITYNRSDCNYLSAEQHNDGLPVLKAILGTVPALADMVKGANVKIKSAAFDSSKVTAHHAIIPTMTSVDLAKLSDQERNIYELIAQRYILQFYPDYTYEQTIYVFESNKRLLYSTVNVPKESGWKAAVGKNAPDEIEESDEYEISKRPDIKPGDKIVLEVVELFTKYTKPKAIYTEATLLKDLTQAAKYCKDGRLRALLIEKDETKAGEKGGIGTPATRSSILKKMFEEEFFNRDGKKIIASKAARFLYQTLPDFAIYPDLTALWFEDQKEVKAGQMTIEQFITKQVQRAKDEIVKLKKTGMNVKPNMPKCLICDKGFLLQQKGQYGSFWRCQDEQCQKTFSDEDGKPVKNGHRNREEGGTCPWCESGKVIKYHSKENVFWKCDNDSCNTFFENIENKPALKLFSCPTCKKGKALKLSKGQYGLYFKCLNSECNANFRAKNGAPDLTPKATNSPSAHYTCKKCGAGLIKYDKGARPFWGCSNFKKTGCKAMYQCNQEGLPIYI